MPLIKIENAREGDVIISDVMIEDVVLFEAGTVIIKKIIEILTILGVENIVVEHRDEISITSIKEAFENIEKRFSYVENDPLMSGIKHIIKDTLANLRGVR